MKSNLRKNGRSYVCRFVSTFVAVIILLSSLTGCVSKEAKATDSLIKAIGTVDLDSEERILSAEAAYEALTNEQKEEVKNHDALLEARAEYDRQVAAYQAEQRRLYAESHSIVPDVLTASIGRDGSAYFPREDGTALKISGDIADARLSADRQTVIVLTDAGQLYWAPADQPANKTEIATKVYSISAVRSSGLIYKSANDDLFRYTFADGEIIDIGNDLAFTVADANLSVLTADSDGNLFILPEGKKQPQRISSYSRRVRVIAISNDTSICVWAEIDPSAKTHTIQFYHDGQVDKLATIDNTNNSTHVTFNKPQTFVAVSDTYLDSLYYMHVSDAELTKVRLGNTLSISSIYTDDGLLEYDTREQIEGIYVLIDSDDGDDLNYINKDGRETLTSKVNDLEIANGYAYFTKTNDGLFVAKLQGNGSFEADRIDRGVKLFEVSVNGEYAYYFNDTASDGIGSLHRYCKETGDSELISSKAYNYYFGYIEYWLSTMYLTPDGTGIFFFESVEQDVDGTYSDIGSLKFSSLDKGVVRIDNEIITGDLSSGLKRQFIDPSFFFFEKYSKTIEDKEIISDLIVNNGENHTAASSVRHSSEGHSSVKSDSSSQDL